MQSDIDTAVEKAISLAQEAIDEVQPMIGLCHSREKKYHIDNAIRLLRQAADAITHQIG